MKLLFRCGVVIAILIGAATITLNQVGAGSCGVTYTQPYVQQTYATQQYVAPTYQQQVVLVPKAIAVEVNRDFYFSVGDYYRDKLIADAVAARLASMQVASHPQAPTASVAKVATPAPQPTFDPNAATDAYPDVFQVLQNNCTRCHGNELKKGKLSYLTADNKMAALDEKTWLKTYLYVRTGYMPQGHASLSDEEIKPLERIAMNSSSK